MSGGCQEVHTNAFIYNTTYFWYTDLLGLFTHVNQIKKTKPGLLLRPWPNTFAMHIYTNTGCNYLWVTLSQGSHDMKYAWVTLPLVIFFSSTPIYDFMHWDMPQQLHNILQH